ncbi:uncharacterized protein LOC144138968 [Haemaphysalis longicornis]
MPLRKKQSSKPKSKEPERPPPPGFRRFEAGGRTDEFTLPGIPGGGNPEAGQQAGEAASRVTVRTSRKRRAARGPFKHSGILGQGPRRNAAEKATGRAAKRPGTRRCGQQRRKQPRREPDADVRFNDPVGENSADSNWSLLNWSCANKGSKIAEKPRVWLGGYRCSGFIGLPHETLSPSTSPRPSWTSIFARDAGGRVTPKTSAFLALLKRVSKDSSSGGRDGLKCLDRLSTVSEIRWACDEGRDGARKHRSPPRHGSGPSRERRSFFFCDDREDTDLLHVPKVPLPTGAPYNLRTSKLPRFMNLNEAPVGKRYRKSTTAAVVASVVILAVGVLAAYMVRKSARSVGGIRSVRFSDDLRRSCRGDTRAATAGCLGAVDQLSDAVDWAVNPCEKLDRFVCGRWQSRNPNRRSYRQESVDNLTASVHDSLLYVMQNLHLFAHEEGNMAVFYNSCRAFLASGGHPMASAADIASALGIRERLATANESAGLQGLLDFVVRSSLRTGLASVIRVSLRAGHAFVDAGESLTSTLGASHVGLFLAAALREMALDTEDPRFMLELDSVVHRCLQEANSSEPFLKVPIGRLGDASSVGASFLDAMNRALPDGVPSYTPDTMVAMRCLRQIAAALTALEAAGLHRAYVYTSTVLLAQVMKYAYTFRREVSSAQASCDLTKVCVNITGHHFKALFPHWVTKNLVAQEVLVAFQAMTKALRQAFDNSAYSRELRLVARDLDELSVSVIGERSVTAATRDGLARVTPTKYDRHFLMNVVRASGDSIGSDYEEHAVGRLLRGEIAIASGDGRSSILVPADFLVADMMYPASKPELNFPTVGVWLLAHWIKAAALNKALRNATWPGEDTPRPPSAIPEAGPVHDWRLLRGTRGIEANAVTGRNSGSGDGPEEEVDLQLALDRKVDCVREEASVVLGRHVSREEGQHLFFVEWALEVAFIAAEARRREVVSRWSKDDRWSRQLFFMRFCHTLCGNDSALDACRYQAARSPELARAFQCREPNATKCS